MLKILIEVLIAFLSLFGAYCLAQVISSFLFMPNNVACAVIVDSKESLEILNETLGQASNALFRVKHKHIVVVFTIDLFPDFKEESFNLPNEYLSILDKYNAQWVFSNDHDTQKSK